LHTPALRINSLPAYLRDAVVFLFHLLSTTTKLFSSLSTRLAHAARFGVLLQKNALDKFTVTVIITVIIIGA